jgi:heat shock protein HtpX
MSKWLLGVRVLDPSKTNLSETEKWLLQSTYHYCQKAGLKKMPEVGIFESSDPNAFATGPTKNRALVAVSTGLLSHMSKDEVEGVIAHEVAHIINGDMVTMTLAQGVVNAFVMFFARVISYFISLNVKEESRPIINFITTIALEIAFSILAMFAISYLSRKREFKADSGGAKLAGHKKMILALESLKKYSEAKDGIEQRAPSLATLQISGKKNRFLSLLSTHPPLELRIQMLKERSF